MTTMTQHAAGMFCWTQLGTPDTDAAKKFYSGLFGWTTEDTTISGQLFTLLRKRDKDIGGLYALLPQERALGPNWMSFIACENTDRTVAQVKQNGGKVLMEPFDVLDHGRSAVCEDPTHGTFGLWQAKKQIGAGVVNEVGSMCWNELITDDTNKAGTFYKQTFGWTQENMPGLRGPYTIFKKDGAQAGGMMKASPEMHLTHPYWLAYFAVDDCDKSVAKAEKLGGKAMVQPTDIPNIGRFSVLKDPQGAYFAIIKTT